jgi:DNA-nicking Smr family endonuclease
MKRLDLHGLRHEEARRAVIRFTEDNWNTGEEVQIITGHSARMKSIVVGVLDEYKLNYQTSNMFGQSGHITTWFE